MVVWLFMLVYGLVKNPSTDNAGEKLSMMKYDMAAILENGRSVVYRNENAKFGGALLSVLVRTDSWSHQIQGRDIKILVNLGWKQVSANPDSFCKQGMFAELKEDAGNYRNAPTVLISMRYNATIIKACG
ncbi:hypothetical protein [Burkholderia sp. F1]|uniref:hypothetical protein n=1 Tax=Burkholderia sp. F1 TaxID=3366817 RepID=UPI003D75A9FF